MPCNLTGSGLVFSSFDAKRAYIRTARGLPAPPPAVAPAAAAYNTQLSEFMLPYEAVRTSASPREAVLKFAQSTYEAGANLGKWDRAALER